MSRNRKQNHICTPEVIAQFHEQNKFLEKTFLNYLKATDKADTTIFQYKNDLDIFFCWNVEENNNKPFTQINKKDLIRFQGKALGEWEWSSNRLRREKSTIASLSNYIENILDEEDEFKDFRSIIGKIPNPVNTPAMEPTILEPEELERLLNYLVEHKRYRAACALSLAMNSGRRKSELPRFKVSYFTDQTVLYGSLYKTPETVRTKGPGSKGKPLYLYVLKHPFDPYLKLWLEERQRLGIQSPWLIPHARDWSQPLPVDSLDGWAMEFTKILGKDFYWHCVRHYLTTQFAKANLPTEAIQQFFGWSSIEMVGTYNDQSGDDILGNYFDENGIKTIKKGSIQDI